MNADLGSPFPASPTIQSLHDEDSNENGTEAIHTDTHRASYKELKLTDQTNLLPFRKVVSVFAGLAVCIVVSTLDMTLVATALPSISAEFHAGSVSSFIPSAYLLTSTAFQPLYGRFSDIFGRKVALCLAMAVFMLGNLAAGFSRKISEAIVFRGIAGAGGGGIVSMAQIIMSDVVSLRDRGKYQGIIGVVVALGYGVGPLIGGALSEKVSWRWCFWITLPVSLCGIVIVTYILPLKSVEGDIKRKLLAIDYVGTALTLSGCTLVILPLIWGGVTFPWRSAIVLATLFSGICVVSIFCLWEWKVAKLPIVPMYIFRHVTVSGVYITMFVNGFVFNSSLYYLPQFFQIALGYSPIRSGVFLLPVLVSQTLASFIAGVIVSRTGRYRSIIYIGFGVWAVGCGLLSTVNASSGTVRPVVYMLLAGIGAGQTLQTTTVAAQASVSRRDMSVVTAVRNFVRLLGGTLSLAIGSTIINNSLRAKMSALKIATPAINDIIDDPTVLHPLLSSSSVVSPDLAGINTTTVQSILDGYTHGFRAVFILNSVLAALSVAVAAVMIHHKELTRADEKEMRKLALESLDAQKHRAKGVGRDMEMGVIDRKDMNTCEEAGHQHLPGNEGEVMAVVTVDPASAK
ncbi:MFS general substrate transporter [Fomitiporia mediterranea MF3/22]|uniref:MFS general substrate transporter n=1 Tax=Fomitiporia mediterranea (strain MF3/22) TaxID=694068 RepID=UPI00044090C6|nr:MFS general substrate transporter [Fomitiporia mediterranea MF3/22]EJC99877.1 MFS general substrate transporter [Fomitiporia mediterranea MF3/22]